MLISESIEKYFNEKSAFEVLSQVTIRNRIYELKRFDNHCRSNKINDTESINIDLIISYLGLFRTSKITKSLIIYTLKSYFDFLLKRNFISENISEKIEMPKFNYPEADYIDIEDIEKMFQCERLYGTPKTVVRNVLIMNLFFTLCLRSNEVTNLKIEDIKLDYEQLWIVRKGGQLVKIPLNSNLVELFNFWFIERQDYLGCDSDFVFLSIRGNPMTNRQARHIVSSAMQRVGIVKRKKGTHILRHSGATYRLKNGENIRIIQKLLGHSSLATTERYLHFDDEDFSDLIKRSPKF